MMTRHSCSYAHDDNNEDIQLAGTFVIVVFATGSVVIDSKLGGTLGTPFVTICQAIAVALMVYAFGKISMAHFNPAVTRGFLITGHIMPRQFPAYLSAQVIGALMASACVAYTIGTDANLGANAPNYSFPLPLIIAVEALAIALLMAIIYIVVYTKGLKGFNGIAIGGTVGLDIPISVVCVRRVDEPSKVSCASAALRVSRKLVAVLDSDLCRSRYGCGSCAAKRDPLSAKMCIKAVVDYAIGLKREVTHPNHPSSISSSHQGRKAQGQSNVDNNSRTF
jgi:hypothetical protein